MELRTLTYFLAVADRESFSAAANEVLFVTQPTLSRQMKELEEELGAKLFERGSRKTTLTEAGMRFRERAREIVELARQTEKEFAESSKEEIVGDVYVGGGEVIEARGHDYGVVRTKLKARPWTHWGKCPWIVYTDDAVYYQRYTGRSISIVDALEAIGQPSAFADRKRIAAANGVADYRGTAAQNLQLLTALKAGTLRKP